MGAAGDRRLAGWLAGGEKGRREKGEGKERESEKEKVRMGELSK